VSSANCRWPKYTLKNKFNHKFFSNKQFFMSKPIMTITVLSGVLFLFSCQKEPGRQEKQEFSSVVNPNKVAAPTFNLEVILRGEDNSFGLIKFRQDVDPSKIIVLGTWIRNLEPNEDYILQRAVDPANVVDGECTSSSWLTLGKGLTPQSIHTDDKGEGREELWRDISAIASGTTFDIHFRVLDAATMAVVLTSDCYQYVVR
jgi:hypothetical protein